MSEFQVRDEGDPRKYWTQVPNLIDDTEMSVHAFRLYIHMKRVAGDDGKCWQSTRTLAKACSMSSGMVTKAKKELTDMKLVSISQEKNPKGGKDYHVIKIKDVWGENAKKYSASTPRELASSQDEQSSSLYELSSSPGEIKNIPIKKNTNEKDIKNIGGGGFYIFNLVGFDYNDANSGLKKAINALFRKHGEYRICQLAADAVVDNPDVTLPNLLSELAINAKDLPITPLEEVDGDYY